MSRNIICHIDAVVSNRKKANKNKQTFRKYATLPVSSKFRNDYADYDYLNKLDKKDLAWLKKFHNEFVQASFSHDLPLHKKGHDCYSRNNSRNRDLYNHLKWGHNIYFMLDVDFAFNWWYNKS